jgi:hypothetical protein
MTKHSLIVACALTVLVGAACDDDSSPTDPSTIVPTFTSELLPGNEVPPVTAPNADANARGTVTMRLNVTRDAANNVTTATADFDVTMTGFPANTTLTGAHIHPGRAGLNGGIAINTGIVSGDITLANGSGSFSRNGRNVTPEVAQNLLNDPVGFYFNVHTPLNTGGAIRGQMQRTQ